MKRVIFATILTAAAVFAQSGATGSAPAPKTSTSSSTAKHHKSKKSTAATKTDSQSAAKPVSK